MSKSWDSCRPGGASSGTPWGLPRLSPTHLNHCPPPPLALRCQRHQAHQGSLAEEPHLKECILVSAPPFQAGHRGEHQGEPRSHEPADSQEYWEKGSLRKRQELQPVD